MSEIIIPQSVRRQILLDNLAKLSLQPGDIVIVRDQKDFQMFVDMINQGIALSPHQNPVLCIEGGIERATREDLEAALEFLDNNQQPTTVQ
jgi:hypothetical protein